MKHRVPWQVHLAAMFIYGLMYAMLTIAAVSCIWLRWPYASAILLLIGFTALAFLGPLSLSWSRRSYNALIPLHIAHQTITVLVYAAHYARAGLTEPGGLGALTTSSYSDAIYYSLSIWTTLGTSDFSVTTDLRLLTTLEALTAILFLPVFGAIFWQMLHEMTVPAGEAYMDRRLARKKDI